MGQEKFVLMMSNISSELISKIVQKQDISEEEALAKLCASELYALLEKEDTKLWQYSADMLYELFEQEEKCGKIEFPDV